MLPTWQRHSSNEMLAGNKSKSTAAKSNHLPKSTPSQQNGKQLTSKQSKSAKEIMPPPDTKSKADETGKSRKTDRKDDDRKVTTMPPPSPVSRDRNRSGDSKSEDLYHSPSDALVPEMNGTSEIRYIRQEHSVTWPRELIVLDFC